MIWSPWLNKLKKPLPNGERKERKQELQAEVETETQELHKETDSQELQKEILQVDQDKTLTQNKCQT